MKKFTTDDNSLSIDIDADDYIHFFAVGGRIHFCSQSHQLHIVDDEQSELLHIEFEKSQSITINLKNAKEAREIAHFLGLDVFEFAENGNDFVIKTYKNASK